jgi:simple sugar transport system ATP-binding protein
VLRNLTAEGTSVVFISHKLNEVLDIADRVTVLRRGEKIDTVSTEGATERSLARLMVGRDVLLRVEKAAHKTGEPLLELEHLAALDDRGLPAVRDVSLTVRAGEIVGLAGIDENGQSELIETIMGLRKPESGSVKVAGRDITHAGPRDTLNSGVSHIAEDRHRRGLVLEFSLAENLALREYKTSRYSSHGFLSPKKMVARARTLLKEFDVRGGEPATRAGALSGGNQQKVVIARELNADPRVIIAAQPTRGLDVGAIEFVHRRLVEERDAGRGVLLVSLELEEVRSLCDRVLVIYEGEIVAELPPESSEEDFGVYMTGGGRAAA